MQTKYLYLISTLAGIFIIITLGYIFIFVKKDTEDKVVNATSTLPVAVLDIAQPLAVAKTMSTDASKSTSTREMGQLYYARNIPETTPVGQSDERRLIFNESYTTLYSLGRYSKTPFISAKAYASINYLYLESCSLNTWLLSALTPLLPPADLQAMQKKSYGSEQILAHRILLDFNLKADKTYPDKYTRVVVANEYIYLANLTKTKISSTEYTAMLKTAARYLEESDKLETLIIISDFEKLDLTRRTLSIKVNLALAGLYPKTNLNKELEKGITESASMHRVIPAGSYNNENNIRYLYASYLWKTGGEKNLEVIKQILSPTFTAEYENNAAGWVYGLSLAHNDPAYSHLKEISEDFPELKTFLMKHGWKFK